MRQAFEGIVMFTDLNMEEMAFDTLGEGKADALLRQALLFTGEQVRAAGGRVIKQIGEETLIAFSDATRAADAAVVLQRGVALFASPLAPHLHVSFAWGPLQEEEGDLFGDTVGYAARGSRQGDRAGRIVMNGAAFDRLDETRQSLCRLVDTLNVKGGTKVEYYELAWKSP